MRFEYEITDTTTQTELVNAAKARFAEFREIQARERLEQKVDKAFKIIGSAGQTNVTCSKLFSDMINSMPKYQAILNITVDALLPADKVAFVLDGGSDVDPVTVVLK